MSPNRFFSRGRGLFALAILFSAACDSDTDTPPTTPPALTTVTVTLPKATVMVGETITATAAGADQDGAPISTGTVTWASSAAGVATIDADGLITAVTAGPTTISAAAGGKTGTQALTVVAPAAIIVNEVESNGGTPGDWVEFYNPTAAAVDLSGWVVKDNDDTHSYAFPAGTSIAAGGYLVAEEANMVYGLGGADAVRLYNPYGVLVDTYAWTAHATITYGRCPNITGAFTSNTTSTKGAANDCSVVIAIKVNEVESNGGTPGDWIEFYNAGVSAVNLGGYGVKDNDDTHNYVIPAGTTIAPGAYLVVEETAIGFGLGGEDAARLFTSTGTLVDSYSWTAHATTTYGRCADGTGAFVTTAAATKGTANNCPAPGPATFAWPGTGDVTTVDNLDAFPENLSGLTIEAPVGASPLVLWAGVNGPGTIHRLIFNGTVWLPDAANNWGAGKALRFPNGTGNPDTEGITFAGGGSAAGLYVSTERNNDASTVSRNAILRFDPTAAGTTLTATNDWNITADLPVVGANLGIEAVTWIPDTYLTAQGFFDEAKGHVYNPAEYPNHAAGLFLVGVEGNGTIYAYALNHTDNSFTRVATILSGFTGVMGLEFDRELSYLWATCDDGCGGKSSILEIDTGATSPTKGKFTISRFFDRPATMPNINNEGFAIMPQSQCVSGFKPVFWSDDGNSGGHAIRRATVPCVRF